MQARRISVLVFCLAGCRLARCLCVGRGAHAAAHERLRWLRFWGLPFDYSFPDECSDYRLDVVPSLSSQSGVDVESGDGGDDRCVFGYETCTADVELVLLRINAIRAAVSGPDAVHEPSDNG